MKKWLASLPGLQREQIIAERLEKLKQAKDMSTALAVAHRRSSVVDVGEKVDDVDFEKKLCSSNVSFTGLSYLSFF